MLLEWSLYAALGLMWTCAVFFVGGLFRLQYEHERTPVLDAKKPPQKRPFVSLMVPARNEAENLRTCLPTWLNQSYDHFEILIVSDNSTDETEEVVRELAATDPRIRLLSGKPLPPGWAGKNFALHQAVQHARGDVFLFVDADMRWEPDTLIAALGLFERTEADLFSLLTRMITVGFWEKLVEPVEGHLLIAAFPATRINDPQNALAAANGGFLMFDPKAYWKLGGHEAIKAETIDDLTLARRIKGSGGRLICADGTGFVSARLYHSLDELIQGGCRNLFIGLDRRVSLAIGAAMAILFVGLGPYAAIVAGILWPSPTLIALGLFCALILLAQRRLLRQLYGLDSSLAWLQPLAYLVFVYMLGRSVLGGSITWKDRVLEPG